MLFNHSTKGVFESMAFYRLCNIFHSAQLSIFTYVGTSCLQVTYCNTCNNLPSFSMLIFLVNFSRFITKTSLCTVIFIPKEFINIHSSYLLTCKILFRFSEYFVRKICVTLLIDACHHFTIRMSTTVRDIDISLDWLVSRSRTKRADEIGFRFLANCREINVSPPCYVYIQTKTSPLVTLYVEGLFTIFCSQCRAPLSRKPNMNFFLLCSFLLDGWMFGRLQAFT